MSIDGEQIPVTKAQASDSEAAAVTLEALEAALPGKGESSEEQDGSRKPRRRSRSRGRNRNQLEESTSGNDEASATLEQPAAPGPEQASNVRRAAPQAFAPGFASAGRSTAGPAGHHRPGHACCQRTCTAEPAPLFPLPLPHLRQPHRILRSQSAVVVGPPRPRAMRPQRFSSAEVSAATGSVVQMDASGSKKDKPAEPAGQPVMFGVGVPVRELK